MTSLVMLQKARRSCGGSLEPNTNPHLTSYDGVMRYLEEVNKAADYTGTWYGSIYITDEPNLKDVARLWEEDSITHLKQYPPPRDYQL